MLTLSHPAATMLTDVRSQQGMPDDALLRVAPATDGEQGISLGFVDAPMDGDHTAKCTVSDCVSPRRSPMRCRRQDRRPGPRRATRAERPTSSSSPPTDAE